MPLHSSLLELCKIVSLISSSIILLFLLLHDWIDVYPLNDLKVFNAYCSLRNKILMTVVNAPFFMIYLGILLHYWSIPFPLYATIYLVTCNVLFFVGIIFSWWLPYLFGWPTQQVEELRKVYGSTHTFLPRRNNNPIPNTMHVIFHIFFVINMIATYIMLVI